MKCHQWSQCSIGPIRSSQASMYKRISHWSVNVTERTRWLLKRRGSKSSSQGQWLDSSDRCGLVKVTLSWNKVSHAKVQCLQTRDLVAFFSIRRLLGICTTVKRCPAWNATGKGLDLAARCDALEESAAQGLFLTTWYFGRSKHLCLYEFHVICAIWIYFRKVHKARFSWIVPHNGSVAACGAIPKTTLRDERPWKSTSQVRQTPWSQNVPEPPWQAMKNPSNPKRRPVITYDFAQNSCDLFDQQEMIAF